GALWPIGVRVDVPATRAQGSGPAPALLRAVMRVGSERIELPIVEDGTRGFMQSGVLLLDVSKVPGSPATCMVEISAARGFARPPRILRIEPGVLPIVQGGEVTNEANPGLGSPSQRIRLAVPGLRFGPGVAPLKVKVIESGVLREWRRVDDLTQSGPDDHDFELDPVAETLTFGNGINGYMPPFESQIFVDYPYCDGASANTPRNQHWKVVGVAGVFGVNPDAIGGGSDAHRDADLRREARRRLREVHALVTAHDVENAAREIQELEVARAKVPTVAPQTDSQREITLIALRARTSPDEPVDPPETARWLAAVRRALLARMPLGTRLRVRAPRYRSFSVRARIVAMPRRNPADIEQAVKQKLRDTFVLVARPNLTPRAFGAPVTVRDLAALIRAVTGVQRIDELTMLVDGQDTKQLSLGRMDLPRLDLTASRIEGQRAPSGGAT
ncbi:MAG: putative baseplate assembly protein, partial [Steroidobacteraceae bacterium]